MALLLGWGRRRVFRKRCRQQYSVDSSQGHLEDHEAFISEIADGNTHRSSDSPVQVNMGDIREDLEGELVFLRDQQQYLSSTDTEYLSIEKKGPTM